MNIIAPPRIPWQVTGNHWLSLPCIHPADGAVFALGFLHRGTRSAVEFAGGPGFEPRTRALLAALPHVDALLPAGTLMELGAVRDWLARNT